MSEAAVDLCVWIAPDAEAIFRFYSRHPVLGFDPAVDRVVLMAGPTLPGGVS